MTSQSDNDAPPEWREVHLREYSDPVDLYGRDIFSLLNRSKDEVSNVVGRMVTKSEMRTEELPGEYVMSMTGEIADEIHEWPNATLGPEFRHLILQFRENRLVHMIWKYQAGCFAPRKPWWKLW